MNGYAILAIYAAIMLTATLLFARQRKGKDDFYVGDRNMGTLSSAMSIAATWIWAPALFTSAEKAYANGIPGLFWFLAPNILCLIIFIPFAGKIRERMPDGVTLSGFMEKAYRSRGVGRIYSLQLALLAALSTAVQLLAGGKVLSTMTGMDFRATTVLLAAVALSYSLISGIRASVMTDAVQMVFLLAACAVFVPWALSMPGGTDNLLKGLAGASGEYGRLFDAKGAEVFLSFGLPTAIGLISGPFGDQCFWQRAFSIRKEKIGRAFLLGSFLFAAVPLSMGILGYIAAGSGYMAQDSGLVNLELISHIFPEWVAIPFLFMLLSGLLSTVDSNLCAASSLVTDLQIASKLKNNGKLRLSKISMPVLLLIGILVANIPGLTVTHMFLIYGTLRATTLLPTVLTLSGVELASRGITAGIAVAMLTGLPVFSYANIHNIARLKTAASLYTVLIPGLVALLVRWIGGRHGKNIG